MTAALVPLDSARTTQAETTPTDTALVRIRPAPALEPPCDPTSEWPPNPPPRRSTAGVFRSSEARAAVTTGRVVELDQWRRRGGGVTGRPEASADTRRPAGRQDGEVAVREFAYLLQEVLAGRHPARRLRRWARGHGWTHLDWLGLYTRTLQLRGVTHARLRHLRTFRPTDDAIEAAAVMEYGGRVHGVALRFELHADRWYCTCLEIVHPSRTRPAT